MSKSAKGSSRKRKTHPAAPAAPEKVLVLRTCKADMTSHGGFRWPESGPVVAPDWQPTKECGAGLHGWLWGHGDWSMAVKASDARWLVVEVERALIVDLDGKVKFPRGVVIATFGHWRDAMAFIRARRPFDPKAGRVATGDFGHAAATGHSGNAAATGYYGHAAATGYFGHAAATGDYGHAAATGHSGNAAATGHSGWAICGSAGRAKAGEDGVLTLLWHDGTRKRVLVAYVGEGGVKADTWYQIKYGKLAEVSK